MRSERAVVRLLQQHGFAAERVPGSGAAGGRYSGDISTPLLGRDLKGEIKCRGGGRGFKQLYDWLAGNDFLIVHADRKPMLIVAPLKFAASVAAAAEAKR